MKWIDRLLSRGTMMIVAAFLLVMAGIHFSFSKLPFESSFSEKPAEPARGLVLKNANAQTTAVPMIPETFSQLASRIGPAVVNIRTVKTVESKGRGFWRFKKNPFGEDNPMNDFFDRFFGPEHPRDFKQRSLGSGFIIDGEGHIVTNHHVIESADKIKVILRDEKEYDAEIIGHDANTDIALIKIKADQRLPSVNMGDSDGLRVGEWVVAIGNPFGLAHTITAGIVSAKGRVIGSGPYDDFIQTDASINPGNSGGPLIDMNGKVVGINTMIVAGGSGIGFAIPVNLARGIISQLRTEGEVTRGWLGVMIQDIGEDLADYFGLKKGVGVLVAEVVAGDPADQAGIQANDIILQIDGQDLKSGRDLIRIVADIQVGQTARLLVLRNGNKKKFKVKVGKRPSQVTASRKKDESHPQQLGIQVADLTPKTAGELGIDDNKGVVVTAVTPNGKAEAAGVRKGDVIKEVNRKKVRTTKDYLKMIGHMEDGSDITLLLKRMGMGFVVVRLTK